MSMSPSELSEKMHYHGMERAARKLLIDEKLATADEVAIMTSVDVCERLLKFYEVVACESEDITIVKKEDMKTYNAIVKYLSR